MLRKLLSVLTVQDRQAELYRNIIRAEAKIGGQLFGPVPKGGRREFFCLDSNTWIWHEEWTDDKGKRKAITTRYDVRPNGVLKAQDNQPYRYIDLEEAKRLQRAVRLYNRQIDAEFYNLSSTLAPHSV